MVPRALIERLADEQGFDVVGVTRAQEPGDAGALLHRFVANGWHGDMHWLAQTVDRRANPQALWPQARSIVMLAMNYAPPCDPLLELDVRAAGYVSVYARHRDYHDVVKGRLKQLAGRFVARAGGDIKVFVDTAPVMEKPLAQAAGLGWQGKHTNLVSRRFGSWLFLGVLFTTADIAPSDPETDHCGSCRACLDICPTGAFPAPYQLDARRCISYLTIEHKGHIAADLRALMGNRIYGCDDCLAVCPWNKFAQAAREAKLVARADLSRPALGQLAALDDGGFRALFSGSPVKRIGRDRFVRNVLIAIGNSASPRLAVPARALLGDASPLVRAMAVWALSRLMGAADFADLAKNHTAGEQDDAVRAEWQAGLTRQKEA